MKMMNDMELGQITGGSITMGNVGQNNSENQIDPVETFLSWLLGKKFTFYTTGLRSKARNRYFEFVLENDSMELEDLLCASSFCSMKLRRIDTLNVHGLKSGSESYVCPVFRVDGSDMQTFLAFLAIDCPDFVPIGIYMQI